MGDGAVARPQLVLLAHGTDDPAGRAALEAVRSAVTERVADAPVLLAHLGSGPTPVVAVIEALDDAVVVPLLLGSGYHVTVDVPAVVRSHGRIAVTAALGPDPAVVTALTDRVREVVDGRVGAVVLCAAGSGRPRARAQARLAALALGHRLGTRTTTAFLSGAGTGVPEALAWARGVAERGPVVLASYLLAPGHFQNRLRREARRFAVPASAPLGAHPDIVGLVAERYRDATVV